MLSSTNDDNSQPTFFTETAVRPDWHTNEHRLSTSLNTTTIITIIVTINITTDRSTTVEHCDELDSRAGSVLIRVRSVSRSSHFVVGDRCYIAQAQHTYTHI
ncbi:hypothetical protein AB6A40_006099 [Gnathostoma spinigerum]|uniref:Uncharacterized protein n=1 Tax=Gnathostoma spinigerum TaxID=75299 RepID=A0ABD6EII8_9BILA